MFCSPKEFNLIVTFRSNIPNEYLICSFFCVQEYEHDSEDEDEDKYADDIDMPGQNFDSKRRITVRNLRIREDTAKVRNRWTDYIFLHELGGSFKKNNFTFLGIYKLKKKFFWEKNDDIFSFSYFK